MASTTWVLMRDAYERYAASVDAPIRFDSFRRWVTLGKIRSRKPKGQRYKEISLQDLNREISQLRGTPAKKKVSRKKDGPPKRKRRTKKRRATVTEHVTRALGSAQVRELLATKKRPVLIDKTLGSIQDKQAREFLTAYVDFLESHAMKTPEVITQTLVV